MTPGAWVAIFATLLTVVLSVITAVFWAGKVTAKLDILVADSSAAKVELKTFKENCFTRSEAEKHITAGEDQREVLWKKYDKIKKLVIKLLQKAGYDLAEEDI